MQFLTRPTFAKLMTAPAETIIKPLAQCLMASNPAAVDDAYVQAFKGWQGVADLLDTYAAMEPRLLDAAAFARQQVRQAARIKSVEAAECRRQVQAVLDLVNQLTAVAIAAGW